MDLKETTEQGRTIIPVGGTLGILAYGYRGIMMWRQVRHEAEQDRITQFQKANQRNEEN